MYKKKNELYHYGILGQKWGVRRYQNFDGSYTKAGLQRYYKSKDKYESAKSNYKAIKQDSNYSRYEKKYAKAKIKEAKQRMNKDYKHLKQDMLGDKGKVRYAAGERITEKSAVNQLIAGIASLGYSAAIYGYNANIIDKNTAKNIAVGTTVAAGAVKVKELVDSIGDRELRAYYSHTSNY